MRLLARVSRGPAGKARRERIVAAALRKVRGGTDEAAESPVGELPASSLLTAVHLAETERGERPSPDNENFSAPAIW